jgi:NADH dehydrogenase
MSALGVDSGLDTDYLLTKKQGEDAVKKTAGLQWTIFRPSIVFGPNDMFVNMLARMIKLLPLVPVIGDGTYRLQPVSVTNVAEGFIKSLKMPQAIGKTYDIAGPDKFSYNELLDVIGKTLGKKRVRKLHQPLSLVKIMEKIFGRFQSFPITTDKIKMLLSGNVTDDDSFFKEFDISPINFYEGIRDYIKPSSR